ncbi:hypothetical protein DPMN_092684 [Dreissena polymorpha]|uniref:Uncharacterized protein n=1 Tax=Dreissena polymorpha TaxID=45954 RepID=A0A9D4R0A4_DREPO|nr:hypothetical protein DPMN_092684 [Dreissena polymorpha]
MSVAANVPRFSSLYSHHVQSTFIPLPGDDSLDEISQMGEVLTFQDVYGSSTSATPLRPRFRTRSLIEVYTNPESGKDHPDL